MTFGEELDNNDPLLMEIDKECQGELDEASQIERDIIALNPGNYTLRTMLMRLNNAHMKYTDKYADQHVQHADRFYGNKHS